jgi:hypothetical protein
MIVPLVVAVLAVAAVGSVAAMLVGDGVWLLAIIVVTAVVAARVVVPASR